MFTFLLFYLLIIPVCVLLHEAGHGLGVILRSNAQAHVYLGPLADNQENIKIGRLHFHIRWSYYGFCTWSEELVHSQKVAALAGGPIMSLLLAGLASILLPFVDGDLRNFVAGIIVFNGMMFLFTAIPMTYPKWFRSYSGRPSDGLQLLRIWRDMK
jgi:hypothetical protein